MQAASLCVLLHLHCRAVPGGLELLCACSPLQGREGSWSTAHQTLMNLQVGSKSFAPSS